MHILGIESSCDDTSVALVQADKNGFVVLSEKTASQIEVHKKYGGVVPEIAGRCHAENILPVIEEVLKNQAKPDVIAVTSGPGLITGLLVGVEVAKALSYLWNIPIISINHIEGHIYSVKIQETKKQDINNYHPSADEPITNLSGAARRAKTDFQFPCLSLIASGGHTELILSTKQGQYERIGVTIDDAAGECFDKVAKLVGFDYPGGPEISKHAEKGNPNAIKFPRPMLNKDNFNFSFAGLKTSALYWLRDNYKKSDTCYVLRDSCLNDFCASFEQAIIDVLVGKTLKAIEKYNPKTVILAGGVSANKKLRQTLEKEIKHQSPLSTFYFPLSTYCMDNAAMIAIAAYHHALNKGLARRSSKGGDGFTQWQDLKADPNWKIYNK